jgi:gluconokinase
VLLGVPFVDADDLHPAANIAKMTDGVALTDADRWPWLDAVGAILRDGPVVVACSALRRVYRDRLRSAEPDIAFVYLQVDRDVLADRLTHRPGHFMPPGLLDSQLATLEPPTADERAIRVEAIGSVDDTAADAAARLEQA